MRVLMLLAVGCFLVALLGQTGVINGVDVLAWALGGWLAWALDAALGLGAVTLRTGGRQG